MFIITGILAMNDGNYSKVADICGIQPEVTCCDAGAGFGAGVGAGPGTGADPGGGTANIYPGNDACALLCHGIVEMVSMVLGGARAGYPRSTASCADG